ncbi:MAG: UTP--glucose-1-phosphate uridylyltransferase [Clostridia bacterium]|nr:UTP--glucose-1-phosphate uridylyltransferase [Clostridia bacterium]
MSWNNQVGDVEKMGEIEELLRNNHQEHILKMMELCNQEQKQNLLNQVKNIDFNQISNLYSISQNLNSGASSLAQEQAIEPIKYVDKYNVDKEYAKKLIATGEEVIKKGKYAVVTMAGGQGTRLGHDGPKGTYLLNIEPKPKYLFEIFADKLTEVNKKYGITLNWYIMTSSENNKQTSSFFESHDYFGYPKEKVKFFIQDNLPVLSEDGKLLIDKDFNVKFAASGHGNIYKAMRDSGVLKDMKEKGIEWIFIGGVDNVLLNMVDPMLLGLTISEGNQVGSKTIVKANAHEKVGAFCKKNKSPFVIEYTELSDDMAEMTNDKQELVYGESHIMCNLYSLQALEKIASQPLPYHSAHKKADFLDSNGNVVKAESPNAYKYEAFLFDGFGLFDDISILRGRREEDFAPIKNKEGVDSPETAIKLYNHYYSKK